MIKIRYFELIIISILVMKLSIKKKDQTYQVQIQPSKTVGDLKNQLFKLTKIPPIQQQLSETITEKKNVFADDQMPLKIANITQSSQLNLKNLGSQIRWNSVFYIQYGGPLIIFPLLFLFGDRENYNSIQYIALIMAIVHYIKRQLQTAYVHVFSRTSMPLKRVFINSIHYWIFFALCNGVQLYFFPDKNHTYNRIFIGVLVSIWVVAQFCNFKCHTILSSFRQKKQKADGYVNETKQRGIPYGWGFDLVSCANYFWQAVGWIVFSILTRTYMSYMFTFYSIYQMLEWAIKKHKNYRKQFGDKYPRGRKAMFPFII